MVGHAADESETDAQHGLPAATGPPSRRQPGDGLRNREIADRLGVTEDGVRHHLKNIYRKTGTTDRDDAVRRAASMGVQF